MNKQVLRILEIYISYTYTHTFPTINAYTKICKLSNYSTTKLILNEFKSF